MSPPSPSSNTVPPRKLRSHDTKPRAEQPVVIEQANGIFAERRGVDIEEAFRCYTLRPQPTPATAYVATDFFSSEAARRGDLDRARCETR